MHRVKEYLRRAAEADATAAATQDFEVKLQWAQIAEQWRSMAKQAERLAEDGS